MPFFLQNIPKVYITKVLIDNEEGVREECYIFHKEKEYDINGDDFFLEEEDNGNYKIYHGDFTQNLPFGVRMRYDIYWSPTRPEYNEIIVSINMKLKDVYDFGEYSELKHIYPFFFYTDETNQLNEQQAVEESNPEPIALN